jgi:methylmalonyl-CoA/ethylmalonyl-CoA epimerase
MATMSRGNLPLSEATSALGVPVLQIAVVVEDVEKAVREWWEHLGIGPWRIYTYGPAELTQQTYRGKPAAWSVKAALAMSGDVMMELVESVDGHDIWQEQFAERGSSLHHFAFYVPDFDVAVAEMESRGWKIVQSARTYGRSRDGHLAYFEHATISGMFVEVVQPPSERSDPDYIYPEPAD